METRAHRCVVFLGMLCVVFLAPSSLCKFAHTCLNCYGEHRHLKCPEKDLKAKQRSVSPPPKKQKGTEGATVDVLRLTPLLFLGTFFKVNFSVTYTSNTAQMKLKTLYMA